MQSPETCHLNSDHVSFMLVRAERRVADLKNFAVDADGTVHAENSLRRIKGPAGADCSGARC
jgi:hypothetical protein